MTPKRVEKALNSGLSREAAFEELQGTDDADELIYHINSFCTRSDKQKYLVLNLVLVGLLVALTITKVIPVFQLAVINITLLMTLVVPLVNVYIFRKLLLFHKNGYKFLFILSILSLVHAENRRPFELLTTLSMIALSAFLYKKLFDKRSLLQEVEA